MIKYIAALAVLIGGIFLAFYAGFFDVPVTTDVPVVINESEDSTELIVEEVEAVKDDVIAESLKFRIMSQKNPSYTGRILTSLREQFGGHSVKREPRKRN